MTGRDVPTRQKTLSVAFSVIMVLSVMAIGMAGFAGSAAAQTTDGNIANGSVIADSADTGANAQHIFRVEISDGNLDSDTLQNITIDYDDIDLSSSSGIADSDSQGINVGPNQEVRIFIGSGTEIQSSTTADTLDASLNTDRDTLTLGADNTAGDARTIDSYDDGTPSLSSGDTVTVVISASSQDLTNPSATQNVNMTIGGTSGTEGSIDQMPLNLDGDAPITTFDENGDIVANYSVLGSADGDIDGADHRVAVEGTVDNTDPTGGSLSFGTLSTSQDNVTIEGTTSDASVSYDSNNAPLIDYEGDAEGITISDISFDGTDDATKTVDLGTGGEPVTNVSITGNTFTNTTGSAVDVVVDDEGGTPNNVNEISENVFDGVSEAITLDASSLTDDDSVTVSNNNIQSFSGTNGFELTGLGSGVDLTFQSNDFDGGSNGNNAINLDTVSENVTITDGSVNDVSNEGVLVSDSGGDGVTVDGTSFTNITANAVEVATVGGDGDGDNIVLNEVTVDDSSDATGLLVNDANALVDVSGSTTINDTNRGIDVTDAEEVVVSGVEITNTDSSNQAIRFNDPSNKGGGTTLVVNESTSIDQAGTGVEIDVGSDDEATVDVDNVEINGTSSGVDISGVTDDNRQAINVTDSTFTNSDAAGLNYSATDAVSSGPARTRLNVHFNTFENNDVGIGFDDQGSDDFKGIFNATFNDFVDNDIAGLDVERIDSDDGGVVNANYSYWGAPTGPANGGSTQDAFGDGDSVRLSSSSDATVYPFLTEETGSLISDSQQSGSQLIVLPDPERPIGSANDDNTALVGVANLNGSVGASNPDLFAPSANSQPTARSFSGTLSPSNIAQFEVNLSSPSTIDVQGVADGASSNTVQQTYTVQSDSIAFSANRSVVSTDVGAEITAQAVGSNGNPVERQGLNVRFAEDSGFSDAGVTLSSSDGNTSNNGTATAIVQNDGSLTPGQEFTVLANIDGNVERANFSTAAGEIDSGASTLRLNGSAGDFGNLQVDSTVDVSAEISDANNNPLEGRTVEFASNGTVEFGSDSVDTNSDGFANTTATVDTETQGVVAINATAGNFNTTSNSSAQRNITTIAGDAVQLGFASDTRSIAPGTSLNPTVQVQDEFGNFNDTANVNDGISVTSGDTNVISVSGVDDLSSNSDQFTLSAESGGEATITVSSDDSDISGVNDTFTVSAPTAIDLSVAHNVATVSANNSNANTQNQALVTAQFTDSDGNAIGVANENISFGLSGSSAELNQSDVTTKSTDGDGNVTILVNGTDTTGTSTIVATAENFTSINRGETTVTTTGSASGISLSPENDTIAQNGEINVTAEFVDNEGRNVPRFTDVSLSADDGNVTTGTTATAPNDDGAVVSTFTYNSSGASESVTITATGGGLFGETTVTIEEPSVSVTFSDQTVPNGTEEVIVDSANFTRADGSAGDYVMVVHTIDEFGAPVGNVSAPIGASGDLTGAEENITVDLTAADGPIDSITENVTLRAMLHTTANDSAFGTRLGSASAAIDGIERGDETDDANITVEEAAEDAPANFEVSNVTPDGVNVTAGDNITVNADIENVGGQQATQSVEFRIVATDGNTSIDNASATRSQNVTLNASANDTVTFENVSTDGLGAGEFTHGVFTENDSATATITVEEAAEDTPANFSVSGLEPQDATVNVSEAFDVSATVENTGDLQGEQEIELRLEPDGDAVRNQTVSLNASENDTVIFDNVTVDTAGEFNHTVASANDSATGSLTVEQREQEQEPPTATVTFENQTVQNGSTTVNVASATFNGSEEFNIVVHQASDDNDDGTIQASEIGKKIGESEALEPGSEPRTNVSVNISKQVADNDNVSQLTENETLVAMLHTTNTSDDDSIVHTAPITRDGTPVFDQADIGIEPESPLDGPAARFDENADGDISITELGQAGQAFAAGDLSIPELGQVGRVFAR